MTSLRHIVAINIKKKRRFLGFSQAKLAEMVNTAPTDSVVPVDAVVFAEAFPDVGGCVVFPEAPEEAAEVYGLLGMGYNVDFEQSSALEFSADEFSVRWGFYGSEGFAEGDGDVGVFGWTAIAPPFEGHLNGLGLSGLLGRDRREIFAFFVFKLDVEEFPVFAPRNGEWETGHSKPPASGIESGPDYYLPLYLPL